MALINEVLGNTGALTRGLAEMQLAGIKSDRFARFPMGSHGVVNTNHPAFVFGHLSIYPAKLLAGLGLDASSAATPEAFEALFSASAECRDDPDGSIYPDMESVTSAYFRATDAMLSQLAEVDESAFKGENPTERLRDRFPTMGALVEFLTGPHAMFHLGQVSAWRRIEGLGPCM